MNKNKIIIQISIINYMHENTIIPYIYIMAEKIMLNKTIKSFIDLVN